MAAAPGLKSAAAVLRLFQKDTDIFKKNDILKSKMQLLYLRRFLKRCFLLTENKKTLQSEEETSIII